jgi:quinol monooxygenase YgiN
MDHIAVFAKLTARPGERDALVRELQPFVDMVLADEPGTIVYALHATRDEEDSVWLYEVFDGQAGLDAHAANEAARAEVGARVGELLAGPVELVWGSPLAEKGFPD